MKIIVFDLEIKKEMKTGADWARKDLMGISVGVAFDYSSGEYRVFMDDNLQELVDLINDADLVTGFNIDDFDLPLLSAEARVAKLDRPLRPLDNIPTYDLYKVSKAGAGVGKFAKGFNLDNHLEHLFGINKTRDGAEAPLLWKAGKVGTVIDYCLSDVYRERILFEYALAHGSLCTAAYPARYNIEKNLLTSRATEFIINNNLWAANSAFIERSK